MLAPCFYSCYITVFCFLLSFVRQWMILLVLRPLLAVPLETVLPFAALSYVVQMPGMCLRRPALASSHCHEWSTWLRPLLLCDRKQVNETRHRSSRTTSKLLSLRLQAVSHWRAYTYVCVRYAHNLHHCPHRSPSERKFLSSLIDVCYSKYLKSVY